MRDLPSWLSVDLVHAMVELLDNICMERYAEADRMCTGLVITIAFGRVCSWRLGSK